MEIGLHIPDDIAEDICKAHGPDIARHILEAYVIRHTSNGNWGRHSSGDSWALRRAMSLKIFLLLITSRVTTRLPTWNTTVKPPACLASDARCF